MARALGVVQAQHRGADRLEVGPARLDVGVGAAVRVGAGGGGESGEGEGGGKATRAADGDGRERGGRPPGERRWIGAVVRPTRPWTASFGNPAGSSMRAPWLCVPSSRTVCRFG